MYTVCRGVMILSFVIWPMQQISFIYLFFCTINFAKVLQIGEMTKVLVFICIIRILFTTSFRQLFLKRNTKNTNS